MSLREIYKKTVPAGLRERIAGLGMRQKLEAWSLEREGERLLRRQEGRTAGDGRLHVVFILQRPALWENQRSVYRAMAQDERFSVTVIVIPKRPPMARGYDFEEYETEKEFLRAEKIPFVEGYDGAAGRWIHPFAYGVADVYILPQPYNHTQPFMYCAPYLSRFAHVTTWAYGSGMILGPSFYKGMIPCYRHCSHVFVRDPEEERWFGEAFPDVAAKLRVAGSPSLDGYAEPHVPTHGIWKGKGRRRVVWAPHFTLPTKYTPHQYATFLQYAKPFLGLLKDFPEVDFVMRPHPELRKFLVASGTWAQEQVDAYWHAWTDAPNANIYEGGNLIDFFKEADAMVLDSLGFIMHYLPTGKPLCFLEHVGRAGMAESAERVLHENAAAWNEEDVRRFLTETVLGGADPHAERRAELCRRYYGKTLGHAGKNIAEILWREIAEAKSDGLR